MKKLTFTKREDELMNFLWDMDRPLIVEEMVDNAGEHAWEANYLRVMLQSLEKKGAVECCGMLRRNKQYARQFRPAISKEEFYTQLALNRGANTVSLFKVAAAAVRDDEQEVSDDVIQELEEILKEFKARTGVEE